MLKFGQNQISDRRNIDAVVAVDVSFVVHVVVVLLVIVVAYPRNLHLKFGQNRFSNS